MPRPITTGEQASHDVRFVLCLFAFFVSLAALMALFGLVVSR